MKKIILALLIIFLISCQKSNKQKISEVESSIDSLEIEQIAREKTDSLLKNYAKNKILDTTGMHSSPVKVISSRFIEEEYSNYRNIKLVFKNVSNKTIQAIRFEWYGENSFNEPAEMGNVLDDGTGGGFTDQILKPGRTDSGIWNIYSKDGKKILAARAYQVAFSDGTSWKLHD